jgi:hypothetical protein
MLGSILSAFTILATVKIALDVFIADPDELNTALATLVVGSTLAAYVACLPSSIITP